MATKLSSPGFQVSHLDSKGVENWNSGVWKLRVREGGNLESQQAEIGNVASQASVLGGGVKKLYINLYIHIYI